MFNKIYNYILSKMISEFVYKNNDANNVSPEESKYMDEGMLT